MEPRDPNLSQAYRDAAHPEPSSALDARILDAARQAVVKPAVRRRPAWFAWAVPFSSVAVLVLGVTLLLDMQQRAPEVLESPAAIPPAIRLDTHEAQPEPTMQAAPTVIPAKPKEMSRHGKSVESAPPVAKRKHLPSDVLPTPGASASASADRGALVMPAPQPFPAQSMAAPSRVPAETVVRPAPAAAPEAARATGNDAEPSADAMSSPPSTSARSAERAGASASGISTEMHKAAQPVADGPERLVETIRRLIREGRLDQARVTLEKLRQAYPGYDVPEDLKGL